MQNDGAPVRSYIPQQDVRHHRGVGEYIAQLRLEAEHPAKLFAYSATTVILCPHIQPLSLIGQFECSTISVRMFIRATTWVFTSTIGVHIQREGQV